LTQILGRPRQADVVEALAFIGILVLAAWLRLAGIDRTSLFGDEAVYSGQAAALAGDAARAGSFGVFLAHPVLFQLVLGAGFAGGLPDEGGRFLTGLFGVGSVAVAWLIGRLLGGRLVGLAAALLLAVLAYQVYLSRLVMLDGPAAFAVAGSLYAFLRAARDRSPAWLAASAALLGAAILTKEVAVLVLPAVALSAALERRLRLGAHAWVLAALTFASVVAAFVVSIVAGGGVSSTMTYLAYQLSRHDQSSVLTYVRLVDPYFGWPFVALAAVGFLFAVRRGGLARIVAVWAVVPSLLLQAWGLRELQLPMLVVIQAAVLAAVGIDGLARLASRAVPQRWVEAAVGLAILALAVASVVPRTLTATSLPNGQPTQSGLREASAWLRENAGPRDGVFVSTAYKSSVVAYYSRRPAYGFIPASRRDPLYRDPGDLGAFWDAGGIQWVVLDRDSRSRSKAGDQGTAPYDRLVRLLDERANTLAYVVPGRTADNWLAQVYAVGAKGSAAATAEPPRVIGRGDGRVVVLSYAICLAVGAGVALTARRPSPRGMDRVQQQAPVLERPDQ
jgi:dolichyl-phosphate-mannose-protein mannosyltransferase